MSIKFDTSNDTIVTDSGDLKINGSVILTVDNVDGSFPVAGAGLTLGGSPQTYAVGAGDGISVAADSVAVDSTVVRTSGAQSIAGVKTFSSFPVLPAGAPSNDQEAANKAYVDSVAAGLDPKESVRAATTANITLSGTQTIDDVSLIVGNRTLVKNQTNETENGIYVVAAGVWSRSSDMDGTPSNEVSGGNFVFVEEGTTNGNTGWVLTGVGELDLGTDDIIWVQFTGGQTLVAGDGIDFNSNLVEVDNTVVRTTRQVVAGAGLAGGGTLASDVTLNVGAGTGITVNANDIAVNTAAVNHDALLNFVANEHVDHSAVTLTAGAGLTGGGDITASRSFAVGAGTGITVNADSIQTNDSEIVHDNLSGFVANEHIDHSAVTLTAGAGLTGGGNITASRSFAVGAGTGITVNADSIQTNDSQIVHDNLSGFVANEHVDHSAVSVTAGSGLTGGGAITSSVTLNVGAGTGISVAADSVGLDTTSTRNTDHSAVSVTAGSGLTGGGAITSSVTLNVGAGDGISVAADSVAVDSTVVRTSGAQTIGGAKDFTTNPTINGSTNWHSGNDGPGSGLDADSVDGRTFQDDVYTGSQLVSRNASGYAFAQYFNQGSGDNENPSVSQFVVRNGSDNYFRMASLAHVQSALGIPALISARKSVSTDRTNTASPTDDPHLTITFPSAGVYEWEIDIVFADFSSGVADFLFDFGSTGILGVGTTSPWWFYQSMTTAGGAAAQTGVSGLGTDVTIQGAAGAGDVRVRASGVVSAGVGATMTFRWSQAASNANTLRVNSGSVMFAKLVHA